MYAIPYQKYVDSYRDIFSIPSVVKIPRVIIIIIIMIF